MNLVKTKFLIADDDADDASIFCEALHRVTKKLRCDKAENGRDVFKLLAEPEFSRPDVIFIDINMPVMNGWDCLKKLKGHDEFRDIPAIMYSTSSARRDIDMAYRLGAELFLTKPDDFDELCKILEIVATTPQEALVDHLKGFACVKVA